MIESITVSTSGQGLYEVTPEVRRITEVDGRVEGFCTLFLPHTSASLTIQENADPSARHDLERWLNSQPDRAVAAYPTPPTMAAAVRTR